MATITKITLLDLVQAISDFSASDAETVATVAYLVNSGKVRLCGNFAGAKIALSASAHNLRPLLYCKTPKNPPPGNAIK